MTVIDKLASSLNRRDEVPNQELAKVIAEKKDTKAIKELVEHLADKNRNIQSDCIKVLYEAGNLYPSLIAGYVNDFVALLDNKFNRLQWGAMHALNCLTGEMPEVIYQTLPKLAEIADQGSVITRDNYVAILIKLGGIAGYAENIFPLLHEQLLSCPPNQLPMYAENALPIINKANKTMFVQALSARLDDLEKESKRKRVEKVIKKATRP